MKRYVVKNEKNKTYRNMFGVTDYDIPMFGFKSALLILGATMLSLIVSSISIYCSRMVFIIYILIFAFLMQLLVQLYVVYLLLIHNFILKEKKECVKAFGLLQVYLQSWLL